MLLALGCAADRSQALSAALGKPAGLRRTRRTSGSHKRGRGPRAPGLRPEGHGIRVPPDFGKFLRVCWHRGSLGMLARATAVHAERVKRRQFGLAQPSPALPRPQRISKGLLRFLAGRRSERYAGEEGRLWVRMPWHPPRAALGPRRPVGARAQITRSRAPPAAQCFARAGALARLGTAPAQRGPPALCPSEPADGAVPWPARVRKSARVAKVVDGTWHALRADAVPTKPARASNAGRSSPKGVPRRATGLPTADSTKAWPAPRRAWHPRVKTQPRAGLAGRSSGRLRSRAVAGRGKTNGRGSP